MKKFLIVQPFSLLDKTLLVIDDIVYAEEVREMMHVYSPKTKKFIGKLSSAKFINYVMEIPI